MSGITTDTFRTNAYSITDYEREKYVMLLGTFNAVPGDILQLEIYYNGYSYAQTIASTNTDVTPSKLTVFLEVYNGTSSTIKNIQGYCIQHGSFLSQYKISTKQESASSFGIWMYFEFYSFPFVHATTTGNWIPSYLATHTAAKGLTDTSLNPDSFFFGPLGILPGTSAYAYQPIPVLYKLNKGFIETPNGFNVSSSRRYKTNITDLPNNYNLDMVMKMKSIVYQKKDEPGNTKTYPGFIAEDLHDLSGNLFISYNNQNTPDSLDYARLNILLIVAIQQLNKKIDNLAETIEAVKKKKIKRDNRC